jgi:hypothetical protein
MDRVAYPWLVNHFIDQDANHHHHDDEEGDSEKGNSSTLEALLSS